MKDHLEEFERALKRRNFQPNSIKSYLRSVAQFLSCLEVPVEEISRRDVAAHLERLTETGLAPRSRNVALAALRVFAREVLGAPAVASSLPGAMVRPSVPVVLAGTEVQALLAACRKPAHRALLMTLYAAGLRVSEACSLRVENVDSRRMVLRIVGAKTGDRYAPLSAKLLQELRRHYRASEIDGPLLFPGRPKTQPLTRSAACHVLSRAARDARITKKVTPHSLRHSFALHMLELGSDLRSVQLALGHQRISSTVGYLHMSQARLGQIPSPMDQLGTPAAKKLG